MIKKKYIKTRNVYKVSFEIPRQQLPQIEEIETIHIVGDFNDWDKGATQLKKGKWGTYTATVEVEPGGEYQFRYVLNQEHWFNTWEADGYAPNEFGTENGILTVPA